MATMLPQLDYLFTHSPIESVAHATPVAVQQEKFEAPWLKYVSTLPLYTVEGKAKALTHQGRVVKTATEPPTISDEATAMLVGRVTSDGANEAPAMLEVRTRPKAAIEDGSIHEQHMSLNPPEIITDSLPDGWTAEEKAALTLEEWHERQRKLLSACTQAFNPWVGVSRKLRTLLDPGVPVTNAFCKMYEMCFLEEVKAVLHEHGEEVKELRVTFLAEAPALFPVAVMYYLGNRFPLLLNKGLFHYHCTTLPLDDGSAAALPDQYSFITMNREHWHFLDHTSTADTKRLVKEIGPGSQHLVTGDIGKPTKTWNTSEREMYREELGQFIAACSLLSDGGVAVLKMFTAREYSTLCLLRLAIGLFTRTRVFKPLTSRPNNLETYWVLSGFKRKLFEPLFPSLLAVLDSSKPVEAQPEAGVRTRALPAIEAPAMPGVRTRALPAIDGEDLPSYPGFLSSRNLSKEFLDKTYRLLLNQHLRNRAFFRRGLTEFMKARGARGEPFLVQVKLVRDHSEEFFPYTDAWLDSFPIAKLGDMYHRIMKAPPPSNPRPTHERGARDDKKDGEELSRGQSPRSNPQHCQGLNHGPYMDLNDDESSPLW